MEVAVIILSIIAGGFALALVRELRSPERSQSETEFARVSDELGAATVRVAELEEAQRHARERLDELTGERDEEKLRQQHLQAQLSEAREELRGLRAGDEAREKALAERRKELDTHFKGLASEIARESNEEFRKQASEAFRVQRELADKELKQRVEPVGKELESLRTYVSEMEKARTGAYEGVSKLIEETQRQVGRLNSETGDLREILRSSRHRGQWGEATLENILELGGMRKGKSFFTQRSGEKGTSIADFVLRMPGGKRIIVDSKTPFDAYRDALNAASEEEQRVLLQKHADTVLSTAAALRKTGYDQQFENSMDFIVMWIPTDSILEGATRVMPDLIERAFSEHRVLLATPVTMIALVSGVAAALKQEEQQELLHENALAIQAAGQRLYDGVRRHAQVYGRLGNQLETVVRTYDEGVGSVQGNLLQGARQMRELGGGRDGVAAPEPGQLHLSTRRFSRPELVESSKEEEQIDND